MARSASLSSTVWPISTFLGVVYPLLSLWRTMRSYRPLYRSSFERTLPLYHQMPPSSLLARIHGAPIHALPSPSYLLYHTPHLQYTGE